MSAAGARAVGTPLWWEDAPAPTSDPLPTAVDVLIVGAGYTGLWTAYHLLRESPGLQVHLVDAHHPGFGASGRNGGWASSLYPVSGHTLARRHGADATAAFFAALRRSVTDLGEICADEDIDAHYHRGGMIAIARGPAQAARAQASCASDPWGEQIQWWGPHEARERIGADAVLGATFSPHVAAVHPRRLADGLASAVRRRGGGITTDAAVADATPGRVHLADGRQVTARHIVRATEAWTATLPRLRRRIVPVYSLIVATEPLPASTWDELGLHHREVFADHGHVIIYGQRTADGRIVFGGRGAPYHFGSQIQPAFDQDPGVFASLRSTLREIFPALKQVHFTHAWGGPLGIPRDWHPSVGYDPHARVGWAGGYVGDGVAASQLAGRTLAALILGQKSPLTTMPWVGHNSPVWEREPLRWLGVNAGLRLAELADAEERRTGRPARLGPILSALTGGH